MITVHRTIDELFDTVNSMTISGEYDKLIPLQLFARTIGLTKKKTVGNNGKQIARFKSAQANPDKLDW